MSRFSQMPNYTAYNPVGGPYNPGYLHGPQTGMGNQISTAPNSVMQNRYGAFQKNMEKWFPYLGFPSKPIILDPYDDYSRENFDLPEAYYNTQNYAVSLLLINQITAADAYHVTEMLPWKVWEGGDTITWDEWRFEDHMLTRTPEESVSRLLTSTFSQNKEYIVRYGIAMLLEHGFWNTKKGQTSFDMQILQIQNATIETACHGAQMAVLNPDWTKMPGNMSKTRLKRGADREKRIGEEISNFGILVKEPYGWRVALDKARQIMRKRVNRAGNLVQWPAGALKYVATRPEETQQMYGGNGGYKEQPIGAGARVNGERHYETRELRIGEREASVDPSFREVVIGGFGQLEVPHLKHIPAEHFSYDKANIMIYDEGVDKIVSLSYEQLLKLSGLFYVPEGNIDTSFDGDWQLSVIGKQWFAEHRTWGDYLQSKGGLDFFLKGVQYLNDERFSVFLTWFVKKAQQDSTLQQSQKDELQAQRQRVLGGWQAGQTLMPAALLEEDEDKEIDTEAKGLFGIQKEYKSLDTFQADIQKLRTPFADQLLVYSSVLSKGFPVLPRKNANAAVDNTYNLKIAAVYDDTDDKSLALSIMRTATYGLHAEALNAWGDYAAGNRGTAGSDGHRTDQTHGVVRAEANLHLLTYVLGDKNVEQLEPFKGTHATVAQAVAANEGDFKAQPDVAENIRQIFRVAVMYATQALPAHYVPMLIVPGKLHNAQVTASTGDTFVGWLGYVGATVSTCRPLVALIYMALLLNTKYAAWWAIQSAGNAANTATALTEIATRLNDATQPEWASVQATGTAGAAARRTALLTELRLVHVLPPYQWHLLPVLETWKGLLIKSLESSTAPGVISPAMLNTAFQSIMPSKYYLTSKTPSLGVASRMHILESKRRAEVRSLPGIDEPTREALLSVWNANAMERYQEVWSMIEVIYRNIPGVCEAIFRRRVLTFLQPEAKAVGTSVILGTNQAEMTATEYVFIMSLFERIYEKEWAEAKGDDNKRQAAVDRLALICEELYLSRNVTPVVPGGQPDLWALLKTRFPNLWDPSQSVDDFIAAAARPAPLAAATATLQITIEETQKSLLLCVRKMGSRYFSQLERQLPPSMRRRLEASSQDDARASRLLNVDEMDVQGLRNALNAEIKASVDPTYATMVQLSGQHPGGAAGQMTLGGRITTLSDEMKEVRRMFTSDRLATVLKQQKLSSRLMRFALIHNLPPMLGFGLLRPHEIYVMGTMVYMVGGGEAGWTFRGHENFMLQNDAMRKMIFGHFTMYAKSVVFRPEFIVHIENILPSEYVGGTTASCWNPLDKWDRQAYHQGEMIHSCFVFPMDPNEKIERQTIDICGQFHPDLQGQDEPGGMQLHYRAAQILSHVWRWSHPRENPLESRGFGPSAPLRYNTICREMFQVKYQHRGNGTGDYTHYTINQGHWGPRVYAGCGKVRGGGSSMYLEPVPYSGTSTMAIIT